MSCFYPSPLLCSRALFAQVTAFRDEPGSLSHLNFKNLGTGKTSLTKDVFSLAFLSLESFW